ncbi:MAG: RagB/SusD family nutrient uptake outer membrane protein [Candidatus Cryptobacteroides sp.]
MKAKNGIICTLSVLLSISACSSVDLDPTNMYDISYAMKNETNADLYLNSFYSIAAQWGSFGSCALGGANANLSDGLTDILKYGSIAAGAGDCNLIMTVDGQQRVDQNYFDSWTTGYGLIRRINEALQALDIYNANFTSSQSSRIRAELLFFRSHVQFNIMRCHASEKDDLGIIVYKTLSEMSVANKNTARKSVSESWDAILEDLNYACENLPEPSEARGRVHRYAACALKARAMLYARRYDEALSAVKAIEDCQLFHYISSYDEIFQSLDNSEVIWGIAYASGEYTHSFDHKYSMPGDYCFSGSKGGGYAGPTQEFVDAFDNSDGSPFDPSDISRRYITNANVSSRDPRLRSCVLYNGAVWKDRALQCYEGGEDQKYMPYGSTSTPGNTVTGYYMRKLLDESNRDYVLNGSSQSWPEFRYAEVELIKAECLAAKEQYGQAREVVHVLRQMRFGIDEVYTPAVDSWDSALDLILHERMIELCYEGHRFWDLRRCGRAASVLNGKKYSGVLWHKDEAGNFTPEAVSADMSAHKYPERFDRFPIPQSETRNNTLARQNSDW